MDGVSVAASIVAIATAGIQVSIKVVTLAGQISTASDRVSSIGNDVSLTSAILHQLGDLMSQKTTNDSLTIFSQAGLETTKNSADICKRIFEEVERETAKASELIRGRKQRLGEKIKLSIVEKAKWPFLQPGLEILRTDLREAKGTLMLMLQVASLALSKRVADLNISASSSIAEQQDIIRSILILQQQQQQRFHSDYDFSAEPVQSGRRDDLGDSGGAQETDSQLPALDSQTEPRATDVGGRDGPPSVNLTGQEVREFRRLDSINRGRRTSQEEPQDVGVTSFVTSEQPSPATSGMSIPVRGNSNGQVPGKSSPDNRAPQDHLVAGDAKVVELRMCSIYPDIRFELDKVVLAWICSGTRISEDEIRGRLAKNQADGLKTASEILETLKAFELPIVVRGVERIEFANPGGGITLLSVKRTEHDLHHGSIVFNGVPSFHLIIQYDNHSTPRRQAKNSLMRKKSPSREWAPSRAWIFDDHDYHHDSSSRLASDNEGALIEVRARASPTRQHERNHYPQIPTESSGATGTWAEEEQAEEEQAEEELAEEEQSPTEDDRDELADAALNDESGERAAVNKLLEKYTTLFEPVDLSKR